VVHLVVLQGLPKGVRNGLEAAKSIANGYSVLAQPTTPMLAPAPATGLILVNTSENPQAIVTYLMRIPNVEVAAFELSGAWSARGLAPLVKWLRGTQFF
jgi:hypothetical protein